MYEVISDITDIKRFSYSKLNTIWQCPYGYYLTYVKGDRGLNNCFAQCGSYVHEIIEKALKKELLSFELTDYFLEHWDENVPNGVYLKLPSGFRLDLTEKYKEQIVSFFDTFDGFEVNGHKLQIVDAEKNFLFHIRIKDKDIFFQGIIDVLARDDEGNYYILDHKSKKEFKDDEEEAEYARQLYIYSIYVKEKYGVYPVSIVFDLFRTKTLDVIDFNIDDFNAAIDWIYDSAIKIENEQYYSPVDFTKDMSLIETLLNEKENNTLMFGKTSPIARQTTRECNKCKKELEDKMFFCLNLCGHSHNCESWKSALNKYQEITGVIKD